MALCCYRGEVVVVFGDVLLLEPCPPVLVEAPPEGLAGLPPWRPPVLPAELFGPVAEEPPLTPEPFGAPLVVPLVPPFVLDPLFRLDPLLMEPGVVVPLLRVEPEVEPLFRPGPVVAFVDEPLFSEEPVSVDEPLPVEEPVSPPVVEPPFTEPEPIEPPVDEPPETPVPAPPVEPAVPPAAPPASPAAPPPAAAINSLPGEAALSPKVGRATKAMPVSK